MIGYIARNSNNSPRAAIVNLSKARGAKNIRQVSEIIDSYEGEPKEVIELCRLLVNGTSLRPALKLVKEMEADAETVRLVIVNYFAKVTLDKPEEKNLAVLEEFVSSGPYPSNQGKAPLIVSLANLL